MAQEFTIKSQPIEDKINQLLPSQGGFQPGVDFSASTMVVPIVDLTETAEGSNVRQDLQTAFSHTASSFDSVTNSTSTIINTTGYYRLIGNSTATYNGTNSGKIEISDGTTAKIIWNQLAYNVPTKDDVQTITFDLVILLKAGDSCIVTATANAQINVAHRQIADINGNLVDP
tara:strand:+ start:176 stop:694 length:519 start_codon:yes stop_codon:yes gene_type:complete